MGIFEELGFKKWPGEAEAGLRPTFPPGFFKQKDTETIGDVLVPFWGPLDKIPKNRAEVYEIYGRAPKDKNHKAFNKAEMTVAKNLPGHWNSSSHKLYILGVMEEYLREALRRCERLGVIDYIDSMGSYNHRHMRYDTAMPLSYHAWGAAVDINPDSNRVKYRKAFKDVLTTPLQPFDAAWRAQYPNGVPKLLVKAFTSVGFTWGGDWGNKDFSKVNFIDPMHFELISR